MSWQNRCIQRKIAYLALWVVFFSVCAPTISHALASVSGKTWVEICTISGSKLVALDQTDQKQSNLPASLVHCPFCILQNDLPVLPALFHRQAIPFDLSTQPVSVISLSPPLVGFIRNAHLSRAPPSLFNA